MKSIFVILSSLDRREIRQLFVIAASIILVAFTEILSVGTIGPFMSVVADPSIIETNSLLSAVYVHFGFESASSFMVALGVVFGFVVVLANTVTAVVMYWVFRWAHMRSYTLGRRLLSQYLYQPYSFFLNQNTSELSKNILTEVGQVISQVILPGMQMLARGLVAVAIFVFLIVTEPVVAIAVVVVLGGSYAGVFALTRKILERLGRERRQHNLGRFKASGEAFGAIKDVKILGKEPVFERQFANSARGFAWTTALQAIIASLPRYGMQALAVGLVVFYVTVMMTSGARFATVIPVISVYAFAGYRIMPALQEVFQGLSRIRASKPVVEALARDLNLGAQRVQEYRREAHVLEHTKDRLPFADRIDLKRVHFTYPGSSTLVLRDLTFGIRRNATVAFVGPTGCGKTTLIDVVLGLLSAQGEILVDGVTINESNVRRWQRNFGYVPQQIFLADDSVTNNIAFGIESADIDREAVERAARIAHLHEFIAHELPQGYDTLVGERGVRLSGGQRQRIGIARALYHNPDVLVLDEATSSLDTMTEEAVIDAIHELMGRKTIVMIAHRLTTVRDADVIYLMDKGTIVASGTFDELVARNKKFRAMAKM